MKFSAAVLAGGRSTRMGADKAFLRIGNEFLIERQLRCLRECYPAELLLSGRRGVDYSSFGVEVVYDDIPEAGPLAGVTSLLQATAHGLLLILAVDMPAMDPAMLLRILEECTESTGCVPQHERGCDPLAAVYPKTALPLGRNCLNRGRYSMQGFVREAAEGGLVKLLPMGVADRLYFTNWNLPADSHSPLFQE